MAPRSIDFNLLARAAEARGVAAGEVVFSAGDPGSELYVVKSGAVEIRAADGRVLETVGPDGIFGEMALIDNEPRSASAVAVADGEIVPLAERQFLFLVGEAPYFALGLMGVMARRLRAATARS